MVGDEKTTPSLILRGLSKSFGGADALKDVQLEVLPGEVHGLLGENGSGKSTLIKVLAGFHPPDTGTLSIRGKSVPLPLTPGSYRALGMQFVHQDLGLVPSLSVLQNLRLGSFAARRGMRTINWRDEQRKARASLAQYGLSIDVGGMVGELRPVEQALVAIVRAVEDMSEGLGKTDAEGGILCLDEPTAFLPKDQVDQLFGLIKDITSAGSSVIFVSHDLEEVKSVTDRVTVLRNGRNVGTVESSVTSARQLTKLIIGGELESLAGQEARQTDSAEIVLSASDVTSDTLNRASLTLRRGEVLGLTGLLGSGFEEFPYALFGSADVTSGELTLFSSSLRLSGLRPPGAMARGLALIPGDRKRSGSIPSLSMSLNMMHVVSGRYFQRGLLRKGAMREDARKLMDLYDIRPRSTEQTYSSFSGGNQQKALMAKWMQWEPQVLLFHEPTQGVDVGARLLIHTFIRAAAASGASVICATSDYEQLAAICDRVVIFSEGREVEQLTGSQVVKEIITERCLRSSKLASS